MNLESKAGLLAMILASVTSSAVAQLLLKAGMSLPAVAVAMEARSVLRIAESMILNPWIVGGMSLYLLGAVVWLFVLSRVEASYAYPFVGLGFIITLLLGRFIMGDVVTPMRIGGTLLVVIGVVLIAAG